MKYILIVLWALLLATSSAFAQGGGINNPLITGTSGHAVPYLDGTNTWTNAQTFSTSVSSPIYSAASTITFQSNGGTVAGYIDAGQRWLLGSSAGFPASNPTLTVSKNILQLPAVGANNPFVQIGAADGSQTQMIMQGWVNAAGSQPAILYARARGTATTPLSLNSGDFVFSNFGIPYTTSGGAAYLTGGGAGFVALTTEACTNTSCGVRLDLYATATGSATTNIGASVGAGLMIGTTATDPGAGGLQINAQTFAPNITTTSAAQTGTVCWTTGTGKFTVDTTVGCLTSLLTAKDITEHLSSAKALSIITQLDPFTFRYKQGWGDSGRYEQFGLGAEQVALVDERLIGRDPNGELQGVRYQELTAVLTGAIQELKHKNDELTLCNSNWRCRIFGK